MRIFEPVTFGVIKDEIWDPVSGPHRGRWFGALVMAQATLLVQCILQVSGIFPINPQILIRCEWRLGTGGVTIVPQMRILKLRARECTGRQFPAFMADNEHIHLKPK